MSITDHEATLARLTEQGYVVIEGVLPRSQLEDLRDAIDVRFAEEREAPFVPDDRSTSAAQDAEIEAFLADNYSVSEVELGRLMQRIRHTCAENHGTPWPVPPREVNKTFLHLPTLFDQDRSQRIWNLLNKEAWCAGLVEHPEVLALVRSILGQDCVLSDCSGTSIGPHTSPCLISRSPHRTSGCSTISPAKMGQRVSYQEAIEHGRNHDGPKTRSRARSF